jgi:L,D-transpeptidase catalytic domain
MEMSEYRDIETGLNRRQILAGGIAAAGVAASARVCAAVDPVLAPIVAPPVTLPTISAPTLAPLVPPVSTVTPPSPARLLALAKREIERNGSKIWLRDLAGVVDYSLPSHMPRFFLLDMVAGKVKPFLVTHGRGSDPENDGWLKTFSNENGSAATSRGAYVTRPWYEGKHGLSMRLVGLEPDNNNAEDRAIVVHGAWYADPRMITEYGKLGRSEGCFAFPEDRLVEVLGRLGPGRLLFADRLF